MTIAPIGKKKAAKKKAAKKAPKLRAVPPASMPPTPPRSPSAKTQKPEVNVSKLTAAETKKRLVTIYELERKRDNAIVRSELAKKSAAAAKRALVRAQLALDKEVEDQRFGPGPLYDADTNAGTGTK